MSDEQPLIRHKAPQPARFPRHRNLGPRLASVSVRGFPDGDKGGAVFSNSGAAVWPVMDIRAFGVTGTGDFTDEVLAAEASQAEWIYIPEDWSVTALVSGNDLTKHYFGGELLVYRGGTTDLVPWHSRFPAYGGDLTPDSTFAPRLGWDRAKWVAVGTSITQHGTGQNNTSTWEIAARILGATCVNLGWAGSYHPFNKDAEAFPDPETGGARGITMTEEDRARLFALHGAGSIWDNDYPGVAPTTTDQLTADVRIREPILEYAPDLFIFDHNHNGRTNPVGTLTPPETAILGVTLGVSTVFQLATSGFVEVGDGFGVDVEGIDGFAMFAGTVTAVSGANVTVSVDSSGYAGTFIEGTAYNLDRYTQCGAYEWGVRYATWCAWEAGNPGMKILMTSSISSYTGYKEEDEDHFDPWIESNAKIARAVAKKFGLAFFDQRARAKVTSDQHMALMTDGTHPDALPSRETLGAMQAEFLNGGILPGYHRSEFLNNGQTVEHTQQREAEYSRFFEGFVTAGYSLGEYVTLLDDDFTGGLGAYTTANTPTIVAAPWNAAESALKCDHDASAGDTVRRTLSMLGAVRESFRIHIASLVGLVASGTKTVTLARVLTAAAAPLYALQLIPKDTDGTVTATLRLRNYSDGSSSSIIQDEAEFEGGTNYDCVLEFVKRTGDAGAVIFTVNGERVSLPVATGDGGVAAPAIVELGVSFSNTALPITVYYGNLLVETAQVHDYGTRFTGSALTLGGKTLTIVNGKVTAEADGLDTIAKKMDMANATGLPVVLKSGSVAAHTGTSAETVLATATIPGGKMGANGKLEITIIGQHTKDVHSKNWRVRLGGIGGTAFLDVMGQNDDCLRALVEIQAKNSQSSQIGYVAGTAESFGLVTGTPVAASMDMTADRDLVITGELVNDSADSMTLQSYTVKFIPGA